MSHEEILDWLELKLDRTFNYFENHLSITLIASFILSLAIKLRFLLHMIMFCNYSADFDA